METHQVNDVVGSLLVTGEEETLAGVSSPRDVVESTLGGLLGLLVGLESLGLDGLGAEEEELLATEQVPFELVRVVSRGDDFVWCVYLLGEAQALGLVAKVALLDGLGLLFGLLSSSRLVGLELLSGGSSSVDGLVVGDSGNIESGSRLRDGEGNRLNGGYLNGLLNVGHFSGLKVEYWVS